MRIYIMGLLVGALGLVAANQVRADEHCGVRSGKVLEVLHWDVEQATKGQYEVAVFIESKDPKAIKNLSGTLEFFAGNDRVLGAPLSFAYGLQPGSEFMQSFKRSKLPAPVMLKAPDLKVFACVAAIEYQDGTSVIIN